ncbi:hypothetical protein SAMN04488503_1914 [Humidesulfovibrio mexicanus]|jgi:hypothetical protein|uniref:Uncharacterized protein n=1 Tax=Humidesulfovibrio mexicanus TaxID=147047 RepID=A0A239A8Q3_9BACT|nr:hypothetical protein [Humidesulfovibrio mexicanus]SNR91950.1 hypothetical protein SAMN04488503_1914 [Humidesulfovibrio mexicanus]
MSRRIREAITHRLNPLHVYCRLCGLGLSSALARSLCRGYERAIYRPLAG